jgi:erythromycin esterase-like protein
MLPPATLDLIREAAQPLTDGEAGDFDALLKLTRDARVMLLGITSCGTHELFQARSEVTRRLIRDRGFTALALQVDAPAAQRIDNFVKDRSDGDLASDALADFTEFPKWMWRNAEMLDFLGWLRNFNDHFSGEAHKVGVYGFDTALPQMTVIWDRTDHFGVARNQHGRATGFVSFTTYMGSVVRNGRREYLDRPAADSVEAVCHALMIPDFFLPIRDAREPLAAALREARLAEQFDALVFFDETRSLEPMDSSGM